MAPNGVKHRHTFSGKSLLNELLKSRRRKKTKYRKHLWKNNEKTNFGNLSDDNIFKTTIIPNAKMY
jgi:hypothetical protein